MVFIRWILPTFILGFLSVFAVEAFANENDGDAWILPHGFAARETARVMAKEGVPSETIPLGVDDEALHSLSYKIGFGAGAAKGIVAGATFGERLLDTDHAGPLVVGFLGGSMAAYYTMAAAWFYRTGKNYSADTSGDCEPQSESTRRDMANGAGTRYSSGNHKLIYLQAVETDIEDLATYRPGLRIELHDEDTGEVLKSFGLVEEELPYSKLFEEDPKSRRGYGHVAKFIGTYGRKIRGFLVFTRW